MTGSEVGFPTDDTGRPNESEAPGGPGGPDESTAPNASGKQNIAHSSDVPAETDRATEQQPAAGAEPPVGGPVRAVIMHAHLRRAEQALQACAALLSMTPGRPHVTTQVPAPAWRRSTPGEARWPATAAILVAIALQVALPGRLVLGPRWLLPGLEIAALAGLVTANPNRMTRHTLHIRMISLVMIGAATLANSWSAALLVLRIAQGRNSDTAGPLLATGAAIWITNIIVFALWYWEFDRGGAVARAQGKQAWLDFEFPQMQNPELAKPDWEPRFADYLYLSFTNATAFSPTDTLPMTRWAKMTMLVQALVALITITLVIARAVNVLR